MGNNLSLQKGRADYGTIKNKDDEGTLLDLYITNFFKNYQNPIEKDINNSEEKKIFREITRYPFKARACCTKSKDIQVALPFVDDTYRDGTSIPKDKIESDSFIKTAYPFIQVFTKDEWGKYNEINGPCNFSSNTIKVDYIVPEGKSHESKNIHYSTGSRPNDPGSSCYRFYLENNTEIEGEGLCRRVLRDRETNFKNNKLKQFYGDIHYANPNNTKFKDVYGDLRKPEARFNNAYGDCNCINSIVERTPQPKEIEENRTNRLAFQQTKDNYCNNDAQKKFVEGIDDSKIDLCVNIAQDIKALATEGSTIEIQQTCKADSKEASTVDNKKVSQMDDEDNSKINESNKEDIKQEQSQPSQPAPQPSQPAPQPSPQPAQPVVPMVVGNQNEQVIPQVIPPVIPPVISKAVEKKVEQIKSEPKYLLYAGIAMIVVIILLFIMMRGKSPTRTQKYVDADDYDEE